MHENHESDPKAVAGTGLLTDDAKDGADGIGGKKLPANGTWMEPDRATSFPFERAKSVWAESAIEILETEVATSFGTTIAYGDLAQSLQERTGVHTKSHQRNWIGDVLGRVLQEAHATGRPPLTSLVVRKGTGDVGVGYQEQLSLVDGLESVEHDELESLAARDRVTCYRRYSPEEIPADTTHAWTGPQAAARRKRAKEAAENRVAPICPSCFIELPVTGACSGCDE